MRARDFQFTLSYFFSLQLITLQHKVPDLLEIVIRRLVLDVFQRITAIVIIFDENTNRNFI